MGAFMPRHAAFGKAAPSLCPQYPRPCPLPLEGEGVRAPTRGAPTEAGLQANVLGEMLRLRSA